MAIVEFHGDKENMPPTAVVAAARRHGVAVKKLKLKRFGMARRRVPLRDITNLFLAAAAAAADATELGKQLEGSSEHAEAESPPVPAPAASPATASAQNWLGRGAALKPARCSLRKEFR
uniref:Uncharacterized protein n=1 Tax=Leersia perrieri TaxID=77586 RepID=A0A0D9WQX4_9ORYZ